MLGTLVQAAAHLRCCPPADPVDLTGALGRIDGCVVARHLQYRLTSELARLLRDGWGPTDLWEVSCRRASALGTALGAAVMPAAVGAVGAEVRMASWEAECSVFEDARVIDPESPDWAAQLEAGLDLLGVLGHLAPLPRLSDGTTAPPPEDPQRAALLAKIKSLLAKAESTEFIDEADSFTAKATELMLRHRIDRAALEASSGAAVRREVVARRCWIEPPYVGYKSLLCQVVAEANNCRAVWHEYGFTTLVGLVDDVDLAELLFASLLVQATRQMTSVAAASHEVEALAMVRAQDICAAWERRGGLPAGMSEESLRREMEPVVAGLLARERRKPSFRRSFLVAYATRIEGRLADLGRQATADAEAEIGACFLPVLARQRQTVDDAVDGLFGQLTSSPIRTTNHAGWVAGRAAAELADLNVRDELRTG
jgi:hypothetical protein